MAEASKRPKSESNEDRISDLSDSLIHHILSFLPSTKEAVRTTVLSKRWHNQWTGVPVLIFNSNGTFYENILKFHNCLKIKKFHWFYDSFDFWNNLNDYYFDEIVSYATRRHVEDLKLMIRYHLKYRVLPELFFQNISLRKLRIQECNLMPKGKVNWASLKELNFTLCSLTNQAIEHILCGSPLLESIQISYCCGFDKFLVTSKYLKRLVLILRRELGLFEILCPNLKELTLQNIWIKDSSLFDQAIKNALSIGSLLESLKLVECTALGQLVISSESLKKLVIGNIRYIPNLQVSCTKLENIEFCGVLNFGKVEFTNLPSSIQVNLDFPHQGNTMITEIHGGLIKDIMQQLCHVNELKLGKWFIEVLPGLDPTDISSPVLYTKCLTLDKAGWFEHQSEVAFILHNLTLLETLVIIKSDREWHGEGNPELTDAQENYWNSIRTVFNCLESHLKTVKVVGTPISENKRKLLLNFIEFLLKNARVLETMVITSIWVEQFKERLLGSPRLSQHAIIELKKWK